MTTETIKRLEELKDRWANDASDAQDEIEIATEVMDALPNLIAAVKERDQLADKLRVAENQAGVATEMMEHAIELKDAAQKACAEMRDVICHLSQCIKDDECALSDADIAHALSTNCGRGYHHERDCEPLREALKPFAACNPSRFGNMPPEKTWLWKPNQTHADPPGISVAHIESAKQALAHWEKVRKP